MMKFFDILILFILVGFYKYLSKKKQVQVQEIRMEPRISADYQQNSQHSSIFVFLRIQSYQMNKQQDQLIQMCSHRHEIIKSSPEHTSQQNFRDISNKLKQIFDSGDDIYLYLSGKSGILGELQFNASDQEGLINYWIIADLWRNRDKRQGQLYMFVDCNYAGSWCFANRRNKGNKGITVFSSCQNYQTIDKNSLLFLRLMLSNKNSNSYNLLTKNQHPQISVKDIVCDFTKQLLNDLHKSIDNVKQLTNMIVSFKEQPTQQQKKESKIIQQKLENTAKQTDKTKVKQKQQSEMILLISQAIKNTSKQPIEVIFHEKWNFKTQQSLKMLPKFWYYSNTSNIYHHKIQNGQYKYDYQEISKDQKKFNQFQHWFRQQKAKRFNVSIKDVQIIKVTQGSINVQYKVREVHQFFKVFHLSKDLFDSRGNKQYPFQQGHHQYGKIDFRGGWPYFLPVKCKRYGLSVRGLYVNGAGDVDDTWLQMNGEPGQWAIAFHGLNEPQQEIKMPSSIIKKRFQSLMSGLGKDSTVFQVQLEGRQAYSWGDSVNKNEEIGNGIYCTPHISTAVKLYTNSGVSIKKTETQSEVYHVVFMCRIRPDKIKVCLRQDYWVINNPDDIRPYGLILVKGQDKLNYPSATQLFGDKQFQWETYKNEIQDNQRILREMNYSFD